MNDTLTIALAQCNPTVGDIAGNRQMVINLTRQAAEQGADLVMFPEMMITGYPPEDLILKRSFQDAAIASLSHIAEALADCPCACLVGGVWREGTALHNAAFIIENGHVQHVHNKRSLPNHGVFDEKRIFTKGDRPKYVEWRGVRLGVLICHDVWDDRWATVLGKQDIELLLVINGSPYEMGKAAQRKNVCELAGRDASCPVLYVNLVGGQDELVFDGRSFAIDEKGHDVVRLGAFTSELGMTRWQKSSSGWQCEKAPMANLRGDMPTIYQSLVLGLRDYVHKNGFPGVVIGLSGGIDSGLTAAIAVDALGADKVHGIFMPSEYTSTDSREDTEQLCKKLGITWDTISIAPAMRTYTEMLRDVFAGKAADTTEENIQARIRGNLLMAYSNKCGHMVLTTGNKSELSVGYATLYGDMCGGYSVLKDVYKTTVFRLSHWRNQQPDSEAKRLSLLLGPDYEVIPPRMITKPPTAELRPDQKDEDSLPPYDVLDAILQGLIERREAIEDLVLQGHDAELVRKVAKMLYFAEYKRRQAPPGVKVTGMSFGRDRRYSITNKWVNQQR